LYLIWIYYISKCDIVQTDYEINGLNTMLYNALLIIAMSNGQSMAVNYEKIEDIGSCQKIAEDVKNDATEGVYVACIPINEEI